MKKILIIAVATIACLLSLAESSLAVELTNPLFNETTDINIVIGRIIQIILGLSGTAALVMFVWGGFLWLISAGEQKRIDAGKKTITWAVIGLLVIFTAYIAVEFLITALTGSTTT